MRIEFLHFELDTDRFFLVRDGQEIRLRPKVFDLLIRLIECRERVVSREELCAHLWQHTSVGEGSLSGLVNELRHALGESKNHPGCLRTVHARGYQFVAEVRTLGVAAEMSPMVSGGEGLGGTAERPKETAYSQRLELLERLAARVLGIGKSQALGLWIEGTAGSGKSCLLDDLIARLANQGWVPYRIDLSGEEFDADCTGDALAEALRDRLAERGATSHPGQAGTEGWTAALLFDRAKLGPRQGACAIEARQHRARVRYALAQHFQGASLEVSAESQIALGVGGMKGAGSPSDLWLGAFFRELRTSPCVLMATSRPVVVDSRSMDRKAFSNQRGIEKVQLRPFDAASLGALFEAEGLPPLPPPLAQALIQYATSPMAPVERVAHWLSGHHGQEMLLSRRIMRSVRPEQANSPLRHVRDEG